MPWPTRVAASTNNFLDHFAGSSLDATRWGSVTSGTGAVTVTDSYVQISAPANSAAFIYNKTKIDKTKSQLWRFCVSNEVGASYPFYMVALRNSATAPTADTIANIDAQERVQWQFANPTGGLGSWAFYNNAAAAAQWWNAAGQTWGGFNIANIFVQPIRNSDYYICGIEIDAVNQRWRMLQWACTYVAGYTFNQGWRLFGLTDWITWANTQAPNTDLWVIFGVEYTNSAVVRTMRMEWCDYCEQGSAGLIESWTASKATAATGHTLRHHWSYDGRTFVPQDRTTDALVAQGAGWESFDLQAPNVVRDGSGTDWLFYNGLDAAFAVTGIGVAKVASATPQNGPWVRGVSNPIVQAQAGENRVRYFFVFKDLLEGNANKRWKCVYSVEMTATTKQIIKLATAPDPPDTSTWTYQGQILGLGGGGSKDENGLWGVQAILFVGGQFEVWYTGVDASNLYHLLRAYGPTLTSLTKDTTDYYVIGSNTQSITANLTGNSVTVGASAGFAQDQAVVLDQDTSIDNWSTSRVRKIPDGTHIELYHGLDGFTTVKPAKIRALNSVKAIGGQEIWKVGSEWWMYMTLWENFIEDLANYGAMNEQNHLFTHTATIPSGAVFAINEFYSPVTSRGFNADLRSVENMGLLRGPLDSSALDTTGGGRPIWRPPTDITTSPLAQW